MKQRTCQAGISGMMVLVVLLLVMLALLAGYMLSRISASSSAQAQSGGRLAAVAHVLEQYASSALRLPCPAQPDADTGEEAIAAVNSCEFNQGTIPWKTIGLRKDDSYDAWGRKISYRVYINGGNGSLTQPRGITMVECDLVENASVLGANRTCNTSADMYQRNTAAADFLNGKGLMLNDLGIVRNDVAYVLVSHGPTGFGGYTASGVRMEMPAGDELRNTSEAGDFTIKAFSDSETAVNTNAHFDDILFYRRLPDLVKQTNLTARDWPEGALLNPATLALPGVGLGLGDTNASTFAFMGNTFTASGGSEAEFSNTAGGFEGIGVVGEANHFINTSEIVGIEFAQRAARIALTLNHFGHFDIFSKHREQAQVRFYDGSSPVGTGVMKQGCRADGTLASFVVEPSSAGSTFTRVEVEGMDIFPALVIFGFPIPISSQFLISEIAACGPTVAACATTLASATNTCAPPSLGAAFAPATISIGAASTLTFTITNGTDNAAHDAMSFTSTLPTGLVIATPTAVAHTCAAATITAAAGGISIAVSGLAIGNDVASCQVTANVATTTAGAYRHTSAAISAITNLTNAVVESTLTVQP